MRSLKTILRLAALSPAFLTLASCASFGGFGGYAPNRDYTAQASYEERYGKFDVSPMDAPASAPTRDRQISSRWSLNSNERAAERKSIAKDTPFATIKPSYY